MTNTPNPSPNQRYLDTLAQSFDSEWQVSDLSPFFCQSLIDVGDGISLCVEVAGDPNNPPLLFVTGLGSQMTFWSKAFLEQFVAAGFFVIRFDNRDTGHSSKIRINGLYIQTLNLLFSSSNHRTFLHPPKPRQFYTLIRRPEGH